MSGWTLGCWHCNTCCRLVETCYSSSRIAKRVLRGKSLVEPVPFLHSSWKRTAVPNGESFGTCPEQHKKSALRTARFRALRYCTLFYEDLGIVHRDGRLKNRDVSGTFRGISPVPVPRDVPKFSTLYITSIRVLGFRVFGIGNLRTLITTP